MKANRCQTAISWQIFSILNAFIMCWHDLVLSPSSERSFWFIWWWVEPRFLKIKRTRSRVRSILGPPSSTPSEELVPHTHTHTHPQLPFCSVMLRFEHFGVSLSVMSNSLQPHGLEPVRLLCPWDFLSQVYWSGLAFPSPGDCPNPGFKPGSPTWLADSLLSEPPGKLNSPNLYARW